AGLATLPDYRGKGYASAVVNRLLSDFYSSGGDIAWLTPGGPDAQRLYLDLGFREVGRSVAYLLPLS
ncbi:MAG: GNAT family N-acetyltransferase, partial [Armatimonadota bacterium]